jgi:hypothetical protein
MQLHAQGDSLIGSLQVLLSNLQADSSRMAADVRRTSLTRPPGARPARRGRRSHWSILQMSERSDEQPARTPYNQQH